MFYQVIFAILIHQKADGAAIHAVDRHLASNEIMKGFEHEAVAAEGDNYIGFLWICAAVALA